VSDFKHGFVPGDYICVEGKHGTSYHTVAYGPSSGVWVEAYTYPLGIRELSASDVRNARLQTPIEQVVYLSKRVDNAIGGVLDAMTGVPLSLKGREDFRRFCDARDDLRKAVAQVEAERKTEEAP
jgi:hypothetical protein